MPDADQRRYWIRWLCGAVSVASLGLVCLRLDFGNLLSTVTSTHVEWFGASVILFGLLFLPAARRWHLVLRLHGFNVSGWQTLRVALIGHFFYLLFFGAAGGDTLRSAYYARRYQFPLPAILATAPVDRALGFAGLVTLVALAVGVLLSERALPSAGTVPTASVLWWVVILAIAVVAVRVWAKRSGPGAFIRRFITALRSTAGELVRQPRVALEGIVCGLVVHLALCTVLALNLRALVGGEIRWFQLAWTLPVISLAGGLPFTVAGLGAREAAALSLLPTYGVGPEQAVSASLLTMTASLFWAAAGGLMLWFDFRHGSDRQATASGPSPTASDPHR